MGSKKIGAAWIGILFVIGLGAARTGSSASPPARLLDQNVDALATGVEQVVLEDGKVSWSLHARRLRIQRRAVLIFGFAGNDEVLLDDCQIEARSESEAFGTVANHFAPMPVRLRDVELFTRENHAHVHLATVDLRPSRAPRLVGPSTR